MLTDEVKTLVDHYAGCVIPTERIESAMPAAERKLQNLIQRFGDDNGKRRQPYYIAQLIAEQIRSDYYAMKFTLMSDDIKEKGYAEAHPIS